MRVSPITTHDHAPTPRRKIPGHIAAAAGRLTDLLLDKDSPRIYEPVSEAAGDVGRFIASRTQQERVRYTHVQTAPLDESTTRYSREVLREYLHTERHDSQSEDRPQPRATISVYGKDYGEISATEDSFMCSLAVFDLDDGGRLVQAVPYEWEGPSYSYEYAGMRGSLAELFGDDPTVKDMEQYARITLGVIEADGSLTEIRPFNQNAFGMELLPVLEQISSQAIQENLDFQLRNGRIEQI